MNRFLILGLLLFPVASSSGSESADATIFETPKVWQASVFLPGSTMRGEGWQIDPTVSNDGIYNTWGITSTVGLYHITGDERLLELIREVQATIRLHEISKGREFAEGFADAGKAQWESIKGVAKDPVGTVTKLPQGAGRFLGRVGSTVKHAVQGQLDTSNTGSPEQAARHFLGIEKAKRLIAAELGVNPYSKNQALQKVLDEVAMVRAFGKLTVNIGSAIVVPVTAGWVLTGTNVASALTQEQVAATPGELVAANRKRALASGISEASFEALNSNPHYDPWTLTAIWNSLSAMAPVDPAVYLGLAAGASTDLDAFFFLRVAQTMSLLQSRGAKIQELLPLSFTVACVTQDGSLIVPLWLDYAIWTPEAKAAAMELQDLATDRKAASVHVVTTGDFSPIAAEQLKAMGIQTHPHSRIP
ncbi:MAG: hypothetical protein WEB60_02485 [Terrimicrobiaceae bacterium]